ncbi:hypothetical protein [Rubrivirga sp. IMCC43871]|uniref:hypothetical protein n=1 Tax=Rubrivirga sp. IMCC43871 TaxID=3391575 RepID=UPI0039903936
MRLALLVLVLSTTAVAQTPRERAEAGGAAFAAARAAAEAERWEEAVPGFEAAVALRPGQATYLYTLARAYAASGDSRAARAALLRLAGLGVVVDEDALGAVLAPVPDAVRAAFDANRQPIGRADTAAVWADPSFGPEGVALDGGRVFVSSMRRGEIVVVEGGVGRVFARRDSASFRGLAADPARRRLWVGVADADGEHGGLMAVDLDTGALAVDLVAVDAARSVTGDLALGPDGAVYASTASGAVARLADRDVTVLVAPGVLPSPQGLALVDGGRALVVADYSTGLHRVDLATGERTGLAAEGVLGVDGLVADGDTLYGVQNGLSPFRIVRIDLDGLRVRSVLANDPRLGEPTHVALAPGGLLVLANAVWPLLGADGAFDPAEASAPLVLFVPLD